MLQFSDHHFRDFSRDFTVVPQFPGRRAGFWSWITGLTDYEDSETTDDDIQKRFFIL
jgi:hypothetical protein